MSEEYRRSKVSELFLRNTNHLQMRMEIIKLKDELRRNEEAMQAIRKELGAKPLKPYRKIKIEI